MDLNFNEKNHPVMSTTLSTIVIHGGSLELVIALLQDGDYLQIKVVDISPKLTFLGKSLDEALNLQKENEDLVLNIQNLPTPLEEFYHKIKEKIAGNEPQHPKLIEDMAENLNKAWTDILKILSERRNVINLNVLFFEHLGKCFGKMAALEVACRDTMIPIDFDAIKDFAEQIKQLRMDMLSSVMNPLLIGNQLVDKLEKILADGTLDTRVDFIKEETQRTINLVKVWLEDLSDKRNNLENAYVCRKNQLDSCLNFAQITKDINELQKILNKTRDEVLISFDLGSSVATANSLLKDYNAWRVDAITLRDRALKITKATEEVIKKGNFSGEQVSQKAYNILSKCTEYYDEIDLRESLLAKSTEFFQKADRVNESFDNLEEQLQNINMRPSSPNIIPVHIKLLQSVGTSVEEALQMGYSLLDEVGRSNNGISGVKKVIEEIEKRKLYLESILSKTSENHFKISEKLNSFLEKYNELFSWLEHQKIQRIINSPMNFMGNNIIQAKECYNFHQQLLTDMEIKNTEINDLLLHFSCYNELEDYQRNDIAEKSEAIRRNWEELNKFILARLSLIDIYIKFFQQAEHLDINFKELQIFMENPSKLNDFKSIETHWNKIQNKYTDLKTTAKFFEENVAKVSDPYLQTDRATNCVEKILNDFNSHQLSLSDVWESWNIRTEINIILEEIMAENMETLKLSEKIQGLLYPIIDTVEEIPSDLIRFVDTKFKTVQNEVHEAEKDLQKRIEKIESIQVNDELSNEKIVQVRNNLNSIKTKLFTINADYSELVNILLDFLKSYETIYESIRSYFNSKKDRPVEDCVEELIKDYEEFKNNTMENFRSLLAQSEKIIDRVKLHEPSGAKEHDTDKIITLLEKLKTFFESKASSENSELKKQHFLSEFNKMLKDINGNLDSLKSQYSEIAEKYSESSAAVKVSSLSYEYFERNVDLLDKRIDTFSKSYENCGNNYSELQPYLNNEIQQTRNRWKDFKSKVDDLKEKLGLARDYFQLLESIENRYHKTYTFLVNSANLKKNDLKSSISAFELIDEIEQYVMTNKPMQMEELDHLANISKKLFGFDKTETLKSDNMFIFQSFEKIKSDIVDMIKDLKEKEDPISLINEIDKNILTVESIEEVVKSDVSHTIVPVQENEIPKFITPLTNISVNEGDQILLQCQVTGHPYPDVKWLMDEAPIQNINCLIKYENGLCTFLIPEAPASDITKFTCVATNIMGRAETTALISVTVKSPEIKTSAPKFVKNLECYNIVEGNNLELKCIVEGHPLPTVQWYKDEFCIDHVPIYNITYNNGHAILKLDNTKKEQSGVYKCKALNFCGVAETSSQINIEPRIIEVPMVDTSVTNVQTTSIHVETISTQNIAVEPSMPNEIVKPEVVKTIKPSIQVALKNTSIFEGKSAKLDCVIVGQPEPEVIWYHNGEPVKESNDIQLLFQGDRCSLLIQEAFVEDAGNYKIVAINTAGEASSQCLLTVMPLNKKEPVVIETVVESVPKFEKLLSDILAVEGQTVEFECALSEGPVDKIKWLFNNNEIVYGDRIRCERSEDGLIKLIINNVTPNDRGVYTVKAFNSLGDSKCFSHLNVKPINNGIDPNAQIKESDEKLVCPNFKELFSDQSVVYDNTAKFECIVVGKPTPKVKWLHNDQPVHGKDFLISTSGERQVLSIPNVNENNVGKISCVAENEVGKATCVGYLTMIAPGEQDSSEQQFSTQEDTSGSSFISIQKQITTVTTTKEADNRVIEERKQEKPTESLPTSFVKTPRKNIAPRFVSPLIGKIVDQGADVVLEGIIDGYPTPKVEVIKNGKECVQVEGKLKITYELNKIVIELFNVHTEDAGRYSCIATNDGGSATSTADLIVKKSIFPPVFGKRLQAQVVQKGNRVLMEVEVTGTPIPELHWLKDERPLEEAMKSPFKIQQFGNCYRLTIENVDFEDSGKYMVKAINSGGEAHSIADFLVVEPQEGRMLEITKTVVFNDVKPEESIPIHENHVPQIIENGNYAAHQELKTQSEIGSSSEQTVITETTRTTQATIRMEHKQNFMDLPVTFSQRTQTPTILQVSEGTMIDSDIQDQTDKSTFMPKEQEKEMKWPPKQSENTAQWPPKQPENTAQWPPKQPEPVTFTNQKPQENGMNWPPKPLEFVMHQPQQEVIKTNNVYFMQQNETHASENICTEQPSRKTAFNFFEQNLGATSPQFEDKYTRYEDAVKFKNHQKTNEEFNSKLNEDLLNMNIEPGPEPELGFMPKTQVAHEKISDKVKKLEHINSQSAQNPISGSVCVFPPQTKKEEVPVMQPLPTDQSTKTVTQFQQSSFSSHVSTSHLSTGAPNSVRRSPSPRPEALAMEKMWVPASKSPVPFLHSTDNQNQQFSHEQTSSFVTYSSQPMYIEKPLPSLVPQVQPKAPSVEKPLVRSPFEPKPTAPPVFKPQPIVQPPQAPTVFKPQPVMQPQAAPVFKPQPVVQPQVSPVFQPQPPVQPQVTPLFKPQTIMQPQAAPVFKPQPVVSPIPNKSQYEVKSSTFSSSQFETKSTAFVQPQYDLKSPSLVQLYEKPQEPIDQIGLERGPPPTMCYAPKPKLEQRQSYVEKIEKSLEANLERVPAKVPEGGIRLFPLPNQQKMKSASPQRPLSMPPQPIVNEFSTSKVTNYDVTTKHETIYSSLNNIMEPVVQSQPPPVLKPEPVVQPRVSPVVQPQVSPVFKPPPASFQQILTPVSQTTEQTDISEENRAITPLWGYRHVEPPKSVLRTKSVEPVPVPPTQFEVPKESYPVKLETSKVEKHTKETTIKQETSTKTAKPVKTYKPMPAPKPKYTFSPVNQPNETYNAYKNFVNAEQSSQVSESYFSQSQNFSSNQTVVDESKNYRYQSAPPQDNFSTAMMKNISLKTKQIKVEKAPEVEPKIMPSMQNLESNTPYTKFDRSSTTTESAQRKEYHQVFPPKFQPIEKPVDFGLKSTKLSSSIDSQQVFKPTPLTPLQSSAELSSYKKVQETTKPTLYYTAVASQPIQTATETSSSVQMKESTAQSHRVVNITKTKRVISLDSNTRQEHAPCYQVEKDYYVKKPKCGTAPTPTKFIPGEFRESDYESDLEFSRIRPVWTPNQSDNDEPHYRRVRPPSQQSRSSSLPRSYGRILTPMEFDTEPVQMPTKIKIQSPSLKTPQQYFSSSLYKDQMNKTQYSSKRTQDDINMNQKNIVLDKASDHMNTINQSFKTKTQKFMKDVVHDINKSTDPSLNEPHAYREESRVSQYGTKHIDPDTGIIYFKYDFGYEFGIIFPGEGKKIIGGLRDKNIQKQSKPLRTTDIELPVYHEKTTNGVNAEFSDSNKAQKRLSLPTANYYNPIQSKIQSRGITPTREYSMNILNRSTTPVNQQKTAPPKRPPIFITPLKDIAVVFGQPARFECIVQGDGIELMWIKNSEILHNSDKHFIEHRNGVCRLTIPQAFPDDAATYGCVVKNSMGNDSTSAVLMVSNIGMRH